MISKKTTAAPRNLWAVSPWLSGSWMESNAHSLVLLSHAAARAGWGPWKGGFPFSYQIGSSSSGGLLPRNLTWNLENDGFQKESPFPGTSVQVPCWISGVYLFVETLHRKKRGGPRSEPHFCRLWRWSRCMIWKSGSFLELIYESRCW